MEKKRGGRLAAPLPVSGPPLTVSWFWSSP